MRRGSPWHPPLSTPHSLISANQDSKYDPFFCSIMHTPADPAVAAPRADGARADGARADGASFSFWEQKLTNSIWVCWPSSLNRSESLLNPKNQGKRSFGPQNLKFFLACRRKRCFAPHEPRRGRSVLTPPETGVSTLC